MSPIIAPRNARPAEAPGPCQRGARPDDWQPVGRQEECDRNSRGGRYVSAVSRARGNRCRAGYLNAHVGRRPQRFRDAPLPCVRGLGCAWKDGEVGVRHGSAASTAEIAVRLPRRPVSATSAARAGLVRAAGTPRALPRWPRWLRGPPIMYRQREESPRALSLEREVDHHDRVLLDDADQKDHAR